MKNQNLRLAVRNSLRIPSLDIQPLALDHLWSLELGDQIDFVYGVLLLRGHADTYRIKGSAAQVQALLADIIEDDASAETRHIFVSDLDADEHPDWNRSDFVYGTVLVVDREIIYARERVALDRRRAVAVIHGQGGSIYQATTHDITVAKVRSRRLAAAN